MTAAKEIYQLLESLESHVGQQDAGGRAVLFKAKERLRMLIIDMDRPRSS